MLLVEVEVEVMMVVSSGEGGPRSTASKESDAYSRIRG